MNEKIQAIALAISGFLVVWFGIFNIIEMDIWGIFYAGIVMIVGFYNWIKIEKQDEVKE